MSTTHSPSPWRIRRPTESEITGGVRKYPAIVAADGFSVCSFGATAKHGKRDAGTVEADAALTVAGPDMLQALRPFAALLIAPLDSVGGGTRIAPVVTVQMVKDAQRAIARAEGRTA